MTTTEVLEVAARAPSVHNTQPWRLVAVPGGFEVWADRSRALPVLDPAGRQLVMSCGAALHHALVGARAQGLASTVAVLPDEAAPDLLARVHLSPGSAPDDEARALLDATTRRRTYRDRFVDLPVDQRVLDEVLSAAAVAPVAVRRVRTEDELTALQVLLARADAQQQQDPAYLEELQRWVHASPLTGHGIPRSSLDPTGGAGSSLALRHFEDLATSVTQDPPAADHPVVAALVTDADGVPDWLAAGQSLSSLLLHATVRGLAAQPLGQVTDSPGWRARLAQVLGVVGTPQLLLRLGHPQHEVPRTPRRATGPA